MTLNRFAVIALCAASIGAHAQSRRSLTVEQAIQIGVENSKTLHSSGEKIEAADARTSELGTSQLPSLKFTGSYTRLSDVPPFTITIPGVGTETVSSTILNNYNLQLSLQQPIFAGFRISGGISAAEHSAEATRLDFDKDRRDFIYTVRVAYWNVFKAAEARKVVDESFGQVSAHLKDVQNLESQGMATTNDVLKVKVQQSNVKLQQIDAANNVQLASMMLDNLIGLPLDTEIDVASAAAMSPHAFGDTRALVQQALDKRPDVKAMTERVKAADDGVTVARGGWYPQIALFGTYTFARPNSRIFPTRDQFDGTWAAGINATWDVWTWGTAGHQTAQAKAQLAQSEDGLGLIKDGIALEVGQNALLVSKAKERISVAQETVSQAEENLRVTNDKFKMGLILNSEVLDAEISLQQAKLGYTQSIVDFELAEAGLEKAIGE